jgi:hypothetical protein
MVTTLPTSHNNESNSPKNSINSTQILPSPQTGRNLKLDIFESVPVINK